MKRLRWQIAVVLATLVVVAVLLLSQQPVLTPVLPEAAPGGVYTEALVGALGRLNPLLDWNNPADRDADRLVYSGLVRFDLRGLPQPDLAESWAPRPTGRSTTSRFVPMQNGRTAHRLRAMTLSSLSA